MEERKMLKRIKERFRYWRKKRRLEKKLKKYEDRVDHEGMDIWYETFVEWAAHTNYTGPIYSTYVREKEHE